MTQGYQPKEQENVTTIDVKTDQDCIKIKRNATKISSTRSVFPDTLNVETFLRSRKCSHNVTKRVERLTKKAMGYDRSAN